MQQQIRRPEVLKRGLLAHLMLPWIKKEKRKQVFQKVSANTSLNLILNKV